MQITGDVEELRKAVKGLSLAEKVLEKANVSALNKTIRTSRAEVGRLINKDYKLTQKEIKSEIKISLASRARPRAYLRGSGSPGVQLFKFAPTPKRTPSTRRLASGGYTPKKGIKVMVRRGHRKIVKGGFIARMHSGHIGVFKRREKGKGIDELFGPSPIRIIDSPRFHDKVEKHAAKTLDKNMKHEADFFLKRAGVLPND